MKKTVQRLGELQEERNKKIDEHSFLLFFYQEADFGPADSDVREGIKDDFRREFGRDVPEGFRDEE